METINCEFSNPLLWNEQGPKNTNEIWNYQKLDCTSTNEMIEMIVNSPQEETFFLTKGLDYGDILIITFLLLFLVFGITKFFINWAIPKKLDWKQH